MVHGVVIIDVHSVAKDDADVIVDNCTVPKIASPSPNHSPHLMCDHRQQC